MIEYGSVDQKSVQRACSGSAKVSPRIVPLPGSALDRNPLADVALDGTHSRSYDYLCHIVGESIKTL